MHTISVELTVIIVIGSCQEIRTQEAEKRNQSFVGLTRIIRVVIRLLKKKKKKSLKGRITPCTSVIKTTSMLKGDGELIWNFSL